MDIKTCDAIITDALAERAKHGVFGYTSVLEEYYRVFSDWMEQRDEFPLKKV